MAFDILRQAVELIRLGRKETARQVLTGLVQTEPHNEAAWLWLAYTQSDDAGRIQILTACLGAVPESQAARQALELLGSGIPSVDTATANTRPPAAAAVEADMSEADSVPAMLSLPSHPGTPPQLPPPRQAARIKPAFVTKPIKSSPILPMPDKISGLPSTPDDQASLSAEQPNAGALPAATPQDVPGAYPYIMKVEHSELPDLPEETSARPPVAPLPPDFSPFVARVEHPELPDLRDDPTTLTGA
jgi:hypothetical protein